MIKQFTLKGDRWVKSKRPIDDAFYEIDFTAAMARAGTTLANIVSTTVKGVNVTTPAVIQGAKVIVKLSGLDVTEGALNCCTFVLMCANGLKFEATMWFELD